MISDYAQMVNKQRFDEIVSKISRDGIDSLVAWLKDHDFFEAPASSRFHGAFKGGLLQHSLNVYDELQRLLKAYPEIKCSEEEAAIIALFHDVCKVDFYTTEKRNRKNEYGKWETYDFYAINERFKFGGHGAKSVYLIQHHMQLTPEEAVAINCHMSAWQDEHVGGSYEQFPLAWLLSVADQSACYVVEPNQKKGVQ